jgi:ABC-type uncharacterized transport system permease subunit
VTGFLQAESSNALDGSENSLNFKFLSYIRVYVLADRHKSIKWNVNNTIVNSVHSHSLPIQYRCYAVCWLAAELRMIVLMIVTCWCVDVLMFVKTKVSAKYRYCGSQRSCDQWRWRPQTAGVAMTCAMW